MRFTNQFFALVAASVAFGYSIPMIKREDSDLKNINDVDKIENGLDKIENDIDNVGNNIENVIENIGNETLNGLIEGVNNATNWITNPECEDAMKKYEECLVNTDVTKDNVDSVCEILNSEKCQTFYKDNVALLPECQISVVNHIIRIAEVDVTLKCSRDESGQYCPLNKFFLDDAEKNGYNIDRLDNKDFKEAIQSTCKSQKCTEDYRAALDILESFKNEAQSLASLFSDDVSISKNKRQDEAEKTENQELISEAGDYLNSDSCKAFMAKVESLTSDATSATYSYGSVLLVSIGLLLATLI